MGKQFTGSNFRQGNQFKRQDDDFVLNRAREFAPVISDMLNLEIASTETIKKGVEKVEELVKKNSGVKTHQIRNIFNLVKEANAKQDASRELTKLRPKLAYVGARQTDVSGKIIVKVVDELIVKITSASQSEQSKMLKGLGYVMESIVAYHKFYTKEKD